MSATTNQITAGMTVLYRDRGTKRARRYLVKSVDDERGVLLYYTSPSARGALTTPRTFHVSPDACRVVETAPEYAGLAHHFAETAAR